MKTFQIDTERLIIRRPGLPDLKDFHVYRSKLEGTKYQGFDIFTLEKARSLIEYNATKTFSISGK